MGSKNPQINLYNPAMLATVEQAFNSTWVVLQARYPFRDFERRFGTQNCPRSEALHPRRRGRDRFN